MTGVLTCALPISTSSSSSRRTCLASPAAQPEPAAQGSGAETLPDAVPAVLDAPALESPSGVAPAEVRGEKGKKVVVCKYVRKPGVAEVFSHIIVVSENALLGKGFAGAFPFSFSDAHFKSVAVRFAAKG